MPFPTKSFCFYMPVPSAAERRVLGVRSKGIRIVMFKVRALRLLVCVLFRLQLTQHLSVLQQSQRGRFHDLPGQPVPALCCPQCKVLPHVEVELLVVQFMAIVPCPVAGHHLKGPGTILLAPAFETFICIDEIPLSLLFSRLKRPGSHSLSS